MTKSDNKNQKFLVDGKYGIKDLVQLEKLRLIFQKFCDATGFTIGFLDHPGMNLLLTVNWLDICVKFHRCSEVSNANCLKSNKLLLESLDFKSGPRIEECGNGLVDCAVPVVVKGKHIASLATGQLFLKPPDMERFRKQARDFGYDEAAYLAAVAQVPVFTREHVERVTVFLAEIAAMISELSLANLELKEEAVLLDSEIKKRHLVEQQLRDYQENLEKKVKDRTADIETFCYSASHDLKSALRRIKTFSGMVGSECSQGLDETGMDYLSRINDASGEAAAMLNGLLDFYLADRGELALEVLDLGAMAKEVLDDMKKSDPERDVEIRVEPGLSARGDRQLMKIVLLNLLGNAWKFTARSRAARIEFGPGKGKNRPEFRISDNGPGFEQPADGMFTPFRRFHKASEFHGSGLGLAITKRILSRHGWELRVESEPGKGTDIFFGDMRPL